MKLQFYRRTDRRWAWRLRASNGQVIATDGGQGYEDLAECERMAEVVLAARLGPLDQEVLP